MSEDAPRCWSDVLKALSRMEAQGVSVNRMASMAGMAQSTLWRYMHGGRMPTIDAAQRLAQVAGLRLVAMPEAWSPQDLLGGGTRAKSQRRRNA